MEWNLNPTDPAEKDKLPPLLSNTPPKRASIIIPQVKVSDAKTYSSQQVQDKPSEESRGSRVPKRDVKVVVEDGGMRDPTALSTQVAMREVEEALALDCINKYITNNIIKEYLNNNSLEVKKSHRYLQEISRADKKTTLKLDLPKEEAKALVLELPVASPQYLSPADSLTVQPPRNGRSRTVKRVKMKKVEHKHYEPGPILVSIVNSYLPIVIFLAKINNLTVLLEGLLKIYRAVHEDDNSLDPSDMLTNKVYLYKLLGSIITLDETKIFQKLLELLPNISAIVSNDFFQLFVINNRPDMEYQFFENILIYIQKNESSEGNSLNKIFPKDKGEDKMILRTASRIFTDDKLVMMARNYFECTQDNNLIMDIFEDMGLSPQEIIAVLMQTEEQERLIRLFRDEQLVKYLKPTPMIERGLFKMLILFHQNHLIEIFNMLVSPGTSRRNVYTEICMRVSRGQDVEAMMNLVTYVSSTFWDLPKLQKLYKALNRLLQNVAEGGIDWLSHIQNPPLFFITLVDFFKQRKAQLDFKDAEMIDLIEDMRNFCKCYLEKVSDDNFKVNIFDKDNRNLDFLHYAMMVGDLEILQLNRCEMMLSELWDLNRGSMQYLSDFMRVETMRNKFSQFSPKILCRKFDIPIEKNDKFQLEFRFASNSVYLKVVTDIFWTTLMVVMDFIYSMRLIDRYKDREGKSVEWLGPAFKANPQFSIIHLYLRISLIISCIVKAGVIKKAGIGGKTLLAFKKIILIICACQMIGVPLILGGSLYWLNILQMLLVGLQVFDAIYKALSLDEIGVTCRIFGRMALVVVVFGTLSFIVMTIIGYAIYVCFAGFTQRAKGQIYTDYNLFSDLYQGILTLYEFVFGAVVLVRPYQEENMYTYAMSFIMCLFSFFGNIMLANMLVAFLTSQFEHISKHAVLLTMQMQHELVQVYNIKDMDGILALPFPLFIPVLPMLPCILDRGDRRRRTNQRLLKASHIVSCFIPVFTYWVLRLLTVVLWRYLEIGAQILTSAKITSIPYFFVWIFMGPLFLLKLLYLDLKTVCGVMLDFRREGASLLDYELDDDARTNLVALFQKVKRVVSFLITGRSLDYISLSEFIECFKVEKHIKTISSNLNVFTAEALAEDLNQLVVPPSGPVEASPPPQQTKTVEIGEQDFADKFTIDELVLAPKLLANYAEGHEKTLDLKFLNDKLRQGVTMENVSRLATFDVEALVASSKFITLEEEPSDYQMLREARQGLENYVNRANAFKEDLKDLKKLLL